jgi:thermitase
MRITKALRLSILSLASIAAMACASPFGSSKSSSSTSSSPVSAAYNKLDVSDSSAWAAAVSAGYVRQGTVLVKTDSSFQSSSLTGLGATQNGSMSLLGGTWRHLSVPAGSESSVILALRKLKGVMVAEPELRLHLPTSETRTRPTGLPSNITASLSSRSLAAKSIVSTGQSTYYTDVFDETGDEPDPYLASAQYNLSIANAYEAYYSYNPSSLSSSNCAYAAVIDTGLNFPHQDFCDTSSSSNSTTNVVVKYAKSAFTRNSATSYTYVGDDESAAESGSSSTNLISISDMTVNWDDDGHGSHVSGIIGALGNNGLGIAGVMWSHLKLLSYKALTDYESDSEEGSGSDWAVYGSLYDAATWWAIKTNHSDSGQVTLPVNMSLGSYYASEFEIEMIAYALSDDVVVIAAMGNDGRTTAEYPAAYTGVIAVGATDGTDTVASFSTRGSWMAVSAPGVDILSTYNGSSSDYEYDSGTSMATPFVTGLSAYALAEASANSNYLLPDQLKALLMESATSISGSSSSSPSSSYGAGRVDVYKTVSSAVTSPPSSGSVYCPYPITITAEVGASGVEDIPVYLYDSGGNFVEVGYTGSGGIISFYLLTPSETYTAKATYNGTMYSQTATTSNSVTVNATLTL